MNKKMFSFIVIAYIFTGAGYVALGIANKSFSYFFVGVSHLCCSYVSYYILKELDKDEEIL